MEKREYGTNPMAECRHDSHEKVDKKKRYRQITSILASYKVTGLTAKEIAARMCEKGLIPTSERNYVSPRLTELCEQGIVEPIGKRVCNWTGKKVTVYRLRGKA
jgi:hypothetical protein